MLTLTNAYSIKVDSVNYTVYRDDTDAARFYVLPETPRIARDEAGKPIFSLIVYRQDETRIDLNKLREDVGGGIMTFTVELAVPPEAIQKLRSKLAVEVLNDDTGERAREIHVEVVTFVDGKVMVSVAGDPAVDTGGARAFTASTVGAGKVSGVGANRKAVMVNLTQAGAALMSQVDRLRTLPINVQYDLSFEHRLVGVRMTVSCDLRSTYSLVQEFVPHEVKEVTDEGGYLDDADYEYKSRDKISKVTESLKNSKAISVNVVPESSAVDQETLTSLEKFGFDMVNREIEKALSPTLIKDAGVDREYLKEFTSTVASSLNFSMDRRMVLLRRHVPSANISNVFQGVDPAEIVSYVDLRVDHFTFLKVPVRVNADFSKLPLDSVVVSVAFERDRVNGGGREQRRESFAFTDGSAVQTFLAYANTLADTAYDWSAVVHYKNSPLNFTVSRAQVHDNFLVVDVGMLGMLQVDVGLGLVDLDRFQSANVSLRYESKALGRTLQQTFPLSKDKQSAVWTEVTHEEPVDGYEYKVDWLRKDGEILPGEWRRETSSRLRVNGPVPSQLTVSVAATGNFKDEISQVVVSLLYADPANQYTQDKSLSFTDDKQTQTWTVDLRDASLRDYRYRYTIIYKDGVVKSVPEEEDKWVDGPPGFIVVGEKYGLEVDVVPALLTYPDHAKVVEVDLTYQDLANDIEDKQSFIFSKESSKALTWRVRTAPHGPRSYTIEVTYYSATGGVTRLPKRTSEAEALVLEPLAPPAPPAPDAPR